MKNQVAEQQSVEMHTLLFNDTAMSQLINFSANMALARIAIPSHLHNNQPDCMAICMQAAQWKMNPFAVAQKTFTQGGKLCYEAQLVNAVVANHAPIKNRLDYEFIGDWSKILGKVEIKTSEKEKGGKYHAATWNQSDEDGLGVRVFATLIDEDKPRELVLYLSQCFPRFSTLWATDPQQQIVYLATKKWARRFVPDVILGVYTSDEIAELNPERDITATSAVVNDDSDFITQDQVNEIEQKLAEYDISISDFLHKARANSISQIKMPRFSPAIEWIERTGMENRQAEQNEAVIDVTASEVIINV